MTVNALTSSVIEVVAKHKSIPADNLADIVTLREADRKADGFTGIILSTGAANERRRYYITADPKPGIIPDVLRQLVWRKVPISKLLCRRRSLFCAIVIAPLDPDL